MALSAQALGRGGSDEGWGSVLILFGRGVSECCSSLLLYAVPNESGQLRSQKQWESLLNY